jgi:CubicO group peptidase (beta-lactamase class C family)
MLLSHTSSIKDNWGGVLNSLWTWGEDSPIPLREFLEGYLTPGGIYYNPSGNFDYSSCPGERWRYSNVGATLAGYLVEAIAGTPFATYCQDSLFAPLSMDETSWYLANVDTTHIAVPYRWTGSGYRRFPHSHSPVYPAFHLRSSTLQLARHLAAFMQCGMIDTVRVLDCPTVELMTTFQYPDLMFGHGLIWYTEPLGGRWLWGHSGSTLGCRTQMRYCAEEYSGAIVLTNGESAYARELIMHEIFEYVRQTTSVPGISDDSPMPQSVTLDQSRPNPFNPTTVLSYGLSRPDRVTLAIYDILGRPVTTLYDGMQEAGQHRATWDATGLSPGVYFARIACQGDIRAVKLVLVR